MDHWTYNFDPASLSSSVDKASLAISKLSDYFPVVASLRAISSTGKTFWSNSLTVHRFDARNIKTAFLDPIQTQFENDIIAAVERGNLNPTPIEITHIVLDVKVVKRKYHICPSCKQEIKRNFSRHLQSCAKGKACKACSKIIPTNLKEHEESCRGDYHPCRLCDKAFPNLQCRKQHEAVCRKFSPSFMRNVQQRGAGATDASSAASASTTTIDPPATSSTSHPGPSSVETALPPHQSALKGGFRVFSLKPPPGTSTDFEGALTFSQDRIVSILDHVRG